MKVKYIYQQFLSHISIIIVAFLILSLVFTQYVETLVYKNKTEELISYGENILRDLDRGAELPDPVINQYARVLFGRDIQFSVFDENIQLLNPIRWRGPAIELTENEWSQLTNGDPIVKNYDLQRFDRAVTLVVLPYLDQGRFIGGILLTSPISGTREMIAEINKYLFYTVLIALAVSFLLSWLLSRIHVNRIKKLQEATSAVSSGDYTVKVPTSDFDEIGELANDFNSMVSKLHESKAEIENLENRRRQFMSDVSHELRTPLTTISGIIEGFKSDMIPEAEKERGINLVSKETRRLIRLVNENLDYDKIRSNQVQLFKEAIELVEVLEIIQDQLGFQAEERNNNIEIEAEESAIVQADYDRLVQILINITKNSIQFTENGRIWLRGRMDGTSTVIEIEDTGIGIDPAEIEQIWHRFYKADISRTSNPFGEFGLGLSIVKQLVQMHDGKISVESKHGKGTKFVIELPFR
ncbi:HAMP domain-containing sensor histidine kinase [Mesobacillus subterraneus]|uniref:sensor histidine kinase n=1 Tax=Mesobacillus subterraneus TaxID=285983 RepID=UPI001CFF193B|nr:HAMP domain-containing sensor histidine kinase [Mesobacillus subterraneus]WLR57595.1 HAMP domain-containing sensor histidine kinase [Mesobacillus subterraneus]